MIDYVTALKILTELGYLPRLGYLSRGIEIDKKAIKLAVAQFQQYYGLRITGKLDRKTKLALGRPRCGFPNAILITRAERLFELRKVRGNRLSVFRIERLWSDIEAVKPKPWPGIIKKPFELFYEVGCGVDIDRGMALERAMRQWEEVRDAKGDFIVKFKPANGEIPHFKVEWTGDNCPGTRIQANHVAEACLPLDCSLPMPVRFNGTKSWSAAIGVFSGSFSVEAVALHEIGHVLGLVHPKKHDNSMMDGELLEGEEPELDPSDKRALRDLYP